MYEYLFDSKQRIIQRRVCKLPKEDLDYILSVTSFLQNNPRLQDRIKAINFGVTEHQKCPCGKLLFYNTNNNSVFQTYCSHSCAAYGTNDIRTVQHKATKRTTRENFTPKANIEESVLRAWFEEHRHQFHTAKTGQVGVLLNSFCGSKESLFFYTSDLKCPTIKERITRFISNTGCKVCGKSTTWISLEDGFWDECHLHSSAFKKHSDKLVVENLQKVSDKLIHNGYSIISSPRTITADNYTLKCKNNHIFSAFLSNGKHNHDLSKLCPQCYPSNISKPEYEIKDWLETLNITVIQQYPIEKYKNGIKKIDLYAPDYKLGIEYDGIMFHSYGKSNHSLFNNYERENKHLHSSRTQLCEAQGIQLLHIFSNEWTTKKDIWKSVILSKLGLTTKIHARKCRVKELSISESKEFMETNHLQGSVNASYRIGLFNNDQLVAVATFGKARYTKADYELLRFATMLNHTVVGGFSKLMSHFSKSHSNITLVSYANRRWSSTLSNVYQAKNFELINISTPNYFYFKDADVLESRMKFQKHKLDHTLGSTESDIMFNSGYRRIWDCGNIVYKYNNE